MVKLQSSASLVDASSALRTIEEEVKVKGQSVNIVIAEISAELQREKQRNAELTERISVLEAQIQQRDKESSLLNRKAQGSCPGHSSGKRKRLGVEEVSESTQNGHSKSKSVLAIIPKANREVKARFSDSECSKDGNSCSGIAGKEEIVLNNEPLVIDMNAGAEGKKEKSENMDGNEVITFQKDTCHKKPYKVAFCPKEVKKILELEFLLQKNGQSHTMRKIIAFASLGIRHGYEDLYELDYNHFRILRKGEPYISPKNPGEHVLYKNPGFRQKIFFPNQENPTLCPVQILEEEKAMRPSDSSCPSCLFLCIKYGGSTRNLPQNEYVRQRMGKNKLKSFGPLMCRMALLVNVRSGSFFFKAVGITLLFMAGLSDDLVQRETKYRSLDLIQKYYRTDDDAEGEQLFLEHLRNSSSANLPYDKPVSKKTPTYKSKTSQQIGAHNKAWNAQHSSAKNSPSTGCALSQFGLIGYSSSYPTKAAAIQSIPSPFLTPLDPGKTFATPVHENPGTISSCHIFPPRPMNCFVPMMFWPPPDTYSSFPSAANYFPHQTLPHCYYGYPPIHPAPAQNSLPRETVHDEVRNAAASGEVDGDSGSSASSS
ncbi:hypothetical protein CDL15_Pgr010679 [Punica granatum]|uniref:Uncharacterized protein n=1 Tax=Punica granatum TaxID=22663 RepID=A0A218XMX6_PUNGR|nr:hypothetical protein CDL15_Pgr010679 [Punica granatum]